MSQINFSVLNTVLAASADYATAGSGNSVITGLPVFPTVGVISKPKTTATLYPTTGGGTQYGFYTLDTNMTLSASGATMTWTSPTTPDCSLGEVLEVTKGGLTYYAGMDTSTGATGTVIIWFGANGTPANGAGYTVTRKGAAFSTITPAALSSSAASCTIGYTQNGSKNVAYQIATFGNPTSPVTFTAANLTTALYNNLNTMLPRNGYNVSKSSTVVYIMQFPNTFLKITSIPSSTTGYTGMAITQYTPITRIGYGADLISEQGYPTATSATANDGIVSTNFYTVENFVISNPVQNTPSVYSLALLVNVGDANAATLIGTIDSTFPLTSN